MSEVLAIVLLAGVVLAEGMALGYGTSKFPPRPTPYRITSLIVEVSAVWLAIRVVL